MDADMGTTTPQGGARPAALQPLPPTSPAAGESSTIEQLGHALQARRETSMAVGILMERRRLGRQAAFEALRSQARSQRRRLQDVAAEIVNAVDALNKP
jgi:hypothetical protein